MNFPVPGDLDELLRRADDFVLYRCVAGSRAYGLDTAESDVDIRGVFGVPANAYLGLGTPPNQISDERGDTVYFSLRRFIELAAHANPNVVELLFPPSDCVLACSDEMQLILDSRELFVTKVAYESHVEYAKVQIKRARGQNKWVNNPQSGDAPTREEFCWFVPVSLSPGGPPLRPVPLSRSGVRIDQCHASSLEHCGNVYRLYYYGDAAKGVFRDGSIVCESIPKSEEFARCIGLLIYNHPEYERAQRDHQHYWEWRQARNSSRWKSQESGEMDYDAKNMMHTFRLLLSAETLLERGQPLVRLTGPHLELLRAIKQGSFSYDELLGMAEERNQRLDSALPHSSLPERPDATQVQELLFEVTRRWERRGA